MKKVYVIYKNDIMDMQNGDEPMMDSIWTDIDNARLYLKNLAEEHNLPFVSPDKYSNKYDNIYIVELNADTPDLYDVYKDL